MPIKFSSSSAGRKNRATYVVITIDTEQDVARNYKHIGTYHNVQNGIPLLLDIFNRYHCKATWMVTPDVATVNADALQKLSQQGHEIGCHVHTEYFTEDSIVNMRHKGYLSAYPADRQADMIARASSIIEKTLGIRPVSFRAGRYGANEVTLGILKDQGFLVDTSVTPGIDWSGDGGPDWSKLTSTQPYLFQGILEVPITIIKFWWHRYWLRPSVSPLSTMEKIANIIISSREHAVLNIMFHSMESIDPNPYLSSRIFLGRLEGIIRYLSLEGARFVTLKQLHEIIKS